MLIFIGGPSGCGKTTIAEKISAMYPSKRCYVLSLDDYYRCQDHIPLHERELNNYDHPDSIEFELIRHHLIQLISGHAIDKPVYDFKTHNRLPITESIDPKDYDFIIVEGIMALHPDIYDLADITAYIHTDNKICFARRLERDQKERGRSKDDIIRQYQTQVFPMFIEHVWPTRLNAECLVFNNKLNEEFNLNNLFALINRKIKLELKTASNMGFFTAKNQSENSEQLATEKLRQLSSF